MAKPTNYSIIPIPEQDVDRTTFTFRQRRAELLKIILLQGHTDLAVVKLGERYGVSPGQITHDKKVLVKFISENYLEPDKVKSDAIVAMRWSMKRAISGDDYVNAYRIADSIIDMCFSLGIIDKAPEKIDASISHESKTLGELLAKKKKKN